MKNLSIEEIAYNEGLQILESTSERNGYPRNLKHFLICDSWEETEAMAAKYGLEIEEFEKRDGWGLWARCGSTFEPYNPTEEWYGDNYKIYDAGRHNEHFQLEMSSMGLPFTDTQAALEYIEKFEDAQAECEEGFDGDNFIGNDVFDTFEEMKDFVELTCKTTNAMEVEATNGDYIVIHDGFVSEVLQKDSISFYHDTHHKVIGLIKPY